ncbi:MAG: hypothetical protein ABII26_01135 [Pseudomonadota bacterium]
MKRIVTMIILLLMATPIGCSQYSTALRNDAENLVNAPSNVVWEKTLQVLKSEKVNLDLIKRSENIISGETMPTFWGDGNLLFINLIPKGEKQTVVHLEVRGKSQTIGLRLQEVLARNIFNKVKSASERPRR